MAMFDRFGIHTITYCFIWRVVSRLLTYYSLNWDANNRMISHNCHVEFYLEVSVVVTMVGFRMHAIIQSHICHVEFYLEVSVVVTIVGFSQMPFMTFIPSRFPLKRD